MKLLLALGFASSIASATIAAPVTYRVDPAHTYPSFETDHMGGLSTWRGKFTSTSGTIVLDRDNSAGSVDVVVDAATVDLGFPKLNERVRSKEFLDATQFPVATYKGVLAGFREGVPTEVKGDLTLHGVTRPLTLRIDRFLCKQNPMTKKEVCGADASGHFNRADYSIQWGDSFGFKMDVVLAIQIEAVRQD